MHDNSKSELLTLAREVEHGLSPTLGGFDAVDPRSRARGAALGNRAGGRVKAGRPRGPGTPVAVQLAKAARNARPLPVDKSKWDDRLRELDELLAEERAYSPQRNGGRDEEAEP